jgi:predicted SprT family Zn-dependent metalloprotease
MTMNEQIVEAFAKCVEKACERWPTLRSYRFTMDIYTFKGKYATWAGMAHGYTIGINLTHARANLEVTIADTVPHEVAHVVQKIIAPNAKQAHGPEWKAICRFLGGTGERCYKDDDYPGIVLKRKTRTRHTYNVGGDIMVLGPKHHNHIQRGTKEYRNTKNGLTITADMYVSSRQLQ